MDLDNLLWFLVLTLKFGLLSSLSSLHIFVSLHVGIEDLPLSGLNGEDGGLWWSSLESSLPVDDDWGLGGTLLVIEHVSEGSLLLRLTVMWHLSISLLDSLIDLIQESSVGVLLLLMELFLVTGFLRVLQENIAFNSVMEHKLVNNFLSLVLSLLP